MIIHHHRIKSALTCICIFLVCFLHAENIFATGKTTVSSGDWEDPLIWSPAGIPSPSDDITIGAGHTVNINSDEFLHDLTIASGGMLTWSTTKTLTIGGAFIVNGTVTMNDGDIVLSTINASFVLGANSSFTWQPGNNTVAAATLFTNGTENFSSTSTLIIKEWYNYAVPLGSVVTGNFGNVVLNSVNSSSLLVEWNQNNYFQSHKILGTLTIDEGWITLDKSGSITNTTIGSIVLSSINSSLYCHNGTHPSSFAITTGNVTNSGGTFYGLNDGNGNVSIQVNGNFTNTGNVKIINNSGVGGVGNGNATFNVTGKFLQSTGDTRLVYNVTTLNSGIYSATFGSMELNGGIFMGQTGVHISNGTCQLNVTNDFTINYSNVADKFRGTSLSSIGSTMNNAKFNMVIGGNLTVAGVSASEFTSSASLGSETITVNGNFQVTGTTLCFNYGAMSASHAVQFTLNGSASINGGGTFLSRNGGAATVAITGNVSMVSGTIAIKGDTGSATISVAGTFNQSGGTFYLHNNITTLTASVISMTINGDFSQSGGTITFDNNSSATSATHTINIAGANYTLSGTGLITHAGPGTTSVFGQLNFSRSGTISFSRTSTSHFIRQVKQTIMNGCTLDVGTGNIQVASHANASTDYLRIATGGTVNTRNGQIISNGLSAYSGMQVDSGGILKTYNTNGLYNGTSNACIDASNNFDFYLHKYSIVEYNGVNNQVISGLGAGIATTSNQKYGILRINFSGDDNIEYVAPAASNVYVRTQLDLVHGELNLNGYTLTIESGATSAATRTSGYIKSEMNVADNTSILLWKNMTTGSHKFPFGVNSTTYIPVDFTPVSGSGGNVSISTRATSSSNNEPFPTGIIDTSVNLLVCGTNVSTENAIDRWWHIDASGFIANVILTYRGVENSSSSGNYNDPVRVIEWNGTGWTTPSGTGTGTLATTGTVSIALTSIFSDWLVIRDPNSLPIQLTAFNVIPKQTEVYISWTTTAEINNDHFNVERSDDGVHFASIHQVNGAGNSSANLDYSFTDTNPIIGTNYYRLKQTDYDGHYAYSETKVVRVPDFGTSTITIKDFGPNPFDKNFWINYHVLEKGPVTFQLTTQSGQLVHSEVINADQGANRYEFTDHSNLQQGIYLLNILHNGKAITQKLIKK
jgi:hypothetical protein